MPSTSTASTRGGAAFELAAVSASSSTLANGDRTLTLIYLHLDVDCLKRHDRRNLGCDGIDKNFLRREACSLLKLQYQAEIKGRKIPCMATKRSTSSEPVVSSGAAPARAKSTVTRKHRNSSATERPRVFQPPRPRQQSRPPARRSMKSPNWHIPIGKRAAIKAALPKKTGCAPSKSCAPA